MCTRCRRLRSDRARPHSEQGSFRAHLLLQAQSRWRPLRTVAACQRPRASGGPASDHNAPRPRGPRACSAGRQPAANPAAAPGQPAVATSPAVSVRGRPLRIRQPMQQPVWLALSSAPQQFPRCSHPAPQARPLRLSVRTDGWGRLAAALHARDRTEVVGGFGISCNCCCTFNPFRSTFDSRGLQAMLESIGVQPGLLHIDLWQHCTTAGAMHGVLTEFSSNLSNKTRVLHR